MTNREPYRRGIQGSNRQYKETENPTTPPNPGNVALGKENTVKIGRT